MKVLEDAIEGLEVIEDKIPTNPHSLLAVVALLNISDADAKTEFIGSDILGTILGYEIQPREYAIYIYNASKDDMDFLSTAVIYKGAGDGRDYEYMANISDPAKYLMEVCDAR